MATLRDNFRREYPDRKFYRRSEFRLDFAVYADETVCIATYIRDLPLPARTQAGFEELLDTAMNDIVDHTLAGREAVRTRNVTEYREWDKGIDEKVEAARQLVRRGTTGQ